MTHLTDEQLSARLDDAMAPAERAECDAHLAACEACQAKLVEMSSLERSLGAALTHDPGEAYFATFAERVAARIAAGEPRPAPAAGAPAPRRSPWAWLLSPRGLSAAGGMAALVLTAGIAWLRFQHEDVTATLRAGAPRAVGSRQEEKTESPSAGASQDRALPPAEATPPQARVDSPEARAAAGSPRAREKAQANAEPAPERAGAQRSQALAPAPQATAQSSGAEEGVSAPMAPPAPAPAEEKQQAMAKHLFSTAPPPARAIAPPPSAAPRAAAEKDALAPGSAQGLTANSQSARDEAHSGGGRPDEVKLQFAEATPLAVQCGTVTDARGMPLSGVQLTLLGTSTRSARSGPDGAFCLTNAVAGDTLILLHVGFEPVRLVLGASTSLVFGLEPVGTLGSRGGLVLGGKNEGFFKLPSAASAPAPDLYAAEPDSVRAAVAQARQRTAIARREHTAEAWEAVASSWDRVAAGAAARAGSDARFQSLSALREAWLATPTPARAERLRARLAAFVAGAPATLPERATAVRWQQELATAAPH
jgi:hypothetical protein